MHGQECHACRLLLLLACTHNAGIMLLGLPLCQSRGCGKPVAFQWLACLSLVPASLGWTAEEETCFAAASLMPRYEGITEQVFLDVVDSIVGLTELRKRRLLASSCL